MSSGRLELVWPGKDKFLLLPKDDDGKPVWVERDHPAASEVRLADFTDVVGDVPEDPHAANLLFTGDSLDVLRILCEVPEYRSLYRGKVKLVYIDPPFNTGQAFEHYDDWMEHSTWLSFMRERLLLIRDLLAPNGVIMLHLDNFEVHRMRLLMDEVFGAGQHLASVVWQRTSAKTLARLTLGTMHETLLTYGRGAESSLIPLFLDLAPEYVAKRYNNLDDRGRFDTGDLTASSHRPHLDSGQPWRGHDPSAKRRCWAVPRAPLDEIGLSESELGRMTMREKLDALDENGYIHWPANSGFPRLKKYLARTRGRAVGDLWTDLTVINSQAAERSGFSTQKPEVLLERVLALTTEPGDVVLDCFAGAGTTAAVAQKMRRRWVTCEILPSTVEQFTRPRLTKVVAGQDVGGITKAVGWSGGGGFRTVQIGPSMYEDTPFGVLLAEWATNGRFARAVAGQLGFEFQPDAAPLCGIRGRMRLAVVDGAVGPEEVRQIVGALAEKERVTIVVKSILSGAESLLGEISPGSRIRKAPRDLLSSGAQRMRRRTEPSTRHTSPAAKGSVP